jgi:hypothetical protein
VIRTEERDDPGSLRCFLRMRHDEPRECNVDPARAQFGNCGLQHLRTGHVHRSALVPTSMTPATTSLLSQAAR